MLTSASAGWRGQRWWWTSPRRTLPRTVQAVALSQKGLDGPPLEAFPHGAVAGRELRQRRAPVRPQASVVDLVARGIAVHLGVEVRKVECGAGEADGYAAAGVEGEEPDTRPAFRRYVGAEVYLREMREPGDRGQEVGPYAGHIEGYYAEPGASFEGVDAQGRRHEGPEIFHSDGPVHEEQVPPAHPEDPRTGRDGVGTVLCPAKYRRGSKGGVHRRPQS
ncbi:MAG: hypothetical protein K0Q96_1539 [Rubrobacteraceae bacterium]|nr:hypothetical protein [Rubrobacteraceae bacterium]